ncbi:MAG: recognition motif protein [Candidatus Acidoferrum typicum]|nr:recognition motif protein [Candidatus Acidoferrum typicum]
MPKLYIGNLSGQLTDNGLQELFAGKGFQVTSARVICDREGGRSRGFGFVELGSSDDVTRAIGEMNGLNVEGRTLQVNEARPEEPRGGGCRSQAPRAYSVGRAGSNRRNK